VGGQVVGRSDGSDLHTQMSRLRRSNENNANLGVGGGGHLTKKKKQKKNIFLS